MGGQRRPDAGRLFHRVGEFGGMRGRQRDDRRRGIALQRRARGVDGDGRVRVEEHLALLPGARHLALAFGLGAAVRVELGADRRQRIVGNGEAAGLAQRRHEPAHPLGVAAETLEQQPLEIGGHLNVHRGRLRRLDAGQLVLAGAESAREDVVLVGGDDQAARSAGPCAWRTSRPACRRNCRSARRRRPRDAARPGRRRR